MQSILKVIDKNLVDLNAVYKRGWVGDCLTSVRSVGYQSLDNIVESAKAALSDERLSVGSARRSGALRSPKKTNCVPRFSRLIFCRFIISVRTTAQGQRVLWVNGKRPSVKNKLLARDFDYYF